jgi:hypothetical protein
MNLAQSHPCPERCSQCGERCYGAKGHSFCATAGRQFATPHQCRKHVWMVSIAEWCEVTRSIERETRRELLDGQEAAHKRLKRTLQTGG